MPYSVSPRLIDHSVGPNPAVDAQFSYQYAVANALLRGRPTLDHFSEPALITDPRVVSLAGRLRVVPDDTFDATYGVLATRVKVTLASGREHERFVRLPRGHPGDPLRPEDLIEKFHSNVAFARARGADVGDGNHIVKRIMSLEDAAAATDLVAWLTPAGSR